MAQISDLTQEQLNQQLQRYLKKADIVGTEDERIRCRHIVQRLRTEISKRQHPIVSQEHASQESSGGEGDACFDQAVMILKSGHTDEACKGFQSLVKRDPKSADAWAGLAICRLYQLAKGKNMEDVMFAFAQAKKFRLHRAKDVDRLVLTHASCVVKTYYTVLSRSLATAKADPIKAAPEGLTATAPAVEGARFVTNSFSQLATVGAGGAGIALDGFSAMTDMKMLQATVLGLVISISASVNAFVNVSVPEYREFKKLLDLIESPTILFEKPELKGSVEPGFDVLLGIGIVFAPFLFAWWTLRKGYTSISRVAAFAWMVMFLAIFTVRNSH